MNMSKNTLLHVTVLPPTRSRILPKLGTLSPIKSKMPTVRVRNAHRFQVNSEKKKIFQNFFALSALILKKRMHICNGIFALKKESTTKAFVPIVYSSLSPLLCGFMLCSICIRGACYVMDFDG